MLSKYDEVRAKRARGDKGFTLIELLVVVVIIGILIAIAIPVYLNYQKSSHDKASGSDARNAVAVMENCYTKLGHYPDGTFTSTSGEGENATNGSKVSLTGCDDVVELSDGTVMKIVSTESDYHLSAYNSDGNKTDASFCYDSTQGGAVAQQKGECTAGSGWAGTP